MVNVTVGRGRGAVDAGEVAGLVAWVGAVVGTAITAGWVVAVVGRAVVDGDSSTSSSSSSSSTTVVVDRNPEEEPDPDEATIRHALEGNLCRCTGYHNIVRSVRAAAEKLAAGAQPEPLPR